MNSGKFPAKYSVATDAKSEVDATKSVVKGYADLTAKLQKMIKLLC